MYLGKTLNYQNRKYHISAIKKKKSFDWKKVRFIKLQRCL